MRGATRVASRALRRPLCRAALLALLTLLSSCSTVHVRVASRDALDLVGQAPRAGVEWNSAARAWIPPHATRVTCEDAAQLAETFFAPEGRAHLEHALEGHSTTHHSASAEAELLCYLNLARLAYAHIAFASSNSDTVRDQLRTLYNYASERVMERLKERGRAVMTTTATETLAVRGWQVRLDPADALAARAELVATSGLRLDGIGRVHIREGFGATFVAVADALPGQVLEQVPYAAATVVLRFSADDFEEAVRSQDVTIEVHDPTKTEALALGGATVPLAANLSAPYALWLAHSRFERQAELALLLRASPLDAPRIYALQPYDPNREIIVLLHGFRSSPATWAKLVNDIAGDAELRSRYQIWQVFYPTNVPPAESQRTIRASLTRAFAALDPSGSHAASRNVTLIGHSMGGVIARLLVQDSGDTLWREVFGARFERARLNSDLAPYLSLSAMPQVDTAIFVAAPHRGVPAAGNWLGRLAARLVRLPGTFVAKVAGLRALLESEHSRDEVNVAKHPTSVRGLRDADNFLRITADLPISSRVSYHTIVGRKNESDPLASSSDGVVPYTSSHLEGAASELVVTSGHSAHASVEAIAEIERILRERTGSRSSTSETVARLETR